MTETNACPVCGHDHDLEIELLSPEPPPGVPPWQEYDPGEAVHPGDGSWGMAVWFAGFVAAIAERSDRDDRLEQALAAMTAVRCLLLHAIAVRDEGDVDDDVQEGGEL